jgi:hypothetical protein
MPALARSRAKTRQRPGQIRAGAASRHGCRRLGTGRTPPGRNETLPDLVRNARHRGPAPYRRTGASRAPSAAWHSHAPNRVPGTFTACQCRSVANAATTTQLLSAFKRGRLMSRHGRNGSCGACAAQSTARRTRSPLCWTKRGRDILDLVERGALRKDPSGARSTG